MEFLQKSVLDKMDLVSFEVRNPDPRWDLSFVLRKKVSGKDSAVTKAKDNGISRSEMSGVCRLSVVGRSVRGSEAQIRIGQFRALRQLITTPVCTCTISNHGEYPFAL